MSKVSSLGEGWAPLEAPLPLLAQTQIRSQTGARLGPEIHGKRWQEAGPASRCLAHCSLLRLYIPRSIEPVLGVRVVLRNRPLSCLDLRSWQTIPTTQQRSSQRASVSSSLPVLQAVHVPQSSSPRVHLLRSIHVLVLKHSS